MRTNRHDHHTTPGKPAEPAVADDSTGTVVRDAGTRWRWPYWPWVWAAVIGAVTLGLVVTVAAVAPQDPDTDSDRRSGAPGLTLPPSWPLQPPITTPGLAGGAGFGLPTTDLFGVRLETPADPAGIAVGQDATRRPNPAAANYMTAAPAGMMWQRGWGGAALPFSVSDGPATVRDGIATGFAPTPQGAGLAAYDALARALSAPEGTWQQVIAARFTPTTTALVDRFSRSRAGTADAARYVVVPEGFRIDEYTSARPDFAVVRVAVRDRTGTAYTSWPMVWTDGDWRVRTPEHLEDLWAPATPVQASAPAFGVWR